MSNAALPAPMVPPEVDLGDFKFMPVDTDRVLKSETWQLGNGDQKSAALTLWLESWHQVPAGSLPSNDRLLAKLSQCDRWPKARDHALRGWVLCSDGRLYHPVVCEKVLEAWIEKLAAAIAGASGNAKRWGVAVDAEPMRQQFRVAVELLRGLAPQSRSLKKKVVAVILAGSPPDHPPDSGGESPPDTPPDRNRQGQGQGQGQGLINTPPDGGGGAAPSAAPPTPPLAFDGRNSETLNGKSVAALAPGFDLPEQWGMDAEALGFNPAEVLHEAEKFRQYWTVGKGKDSRRSVKGWRQSWSNWLEKAAKDHR